MPDDNQSTQDSTTTDNAATAADATSTPKADIDMSGIDPNLQIPSLEDLEYATPSAYIDPDLPATPAAVDTPEEPKEEAPAEETIEMTPEQIAEAIKASNKTMSSVAEKITDSRNILIALSSDPSVDELSAAIALSLFLDRLGKHAIAVYSGVIPSSLGFLSPESNFEENADVFQDFVISISKEKADHIRYKLDGDFVKIFVTPYKSRIAAEDLEFSYGDYNVDLVLALNVDNAIDLDPSLREYGTIMRDAAVVNITTGNPGKFGEIEWSNKFASSVSEMISNLLLSSSGETKIDEHEATTLLTGIVAATDRFAKANTFPGTMQVASKLLDAGADQQLVAANISDDLDNQFFTFSEAKQKAKLEEEAKNSDEIPTFSFDKKEEDEKEKEKEEEPVADGSSLEIAHGDVPTETSEKESGNEEKAPESPESPAQAESAEPTSPSLPPVQAPAEESSENSALLDELKATEASLSNAGAETVPAPTTPSTPAAPTAEMVINPLSTNTATVAAPADVTSKYSQMLEDAIAAPATPAAAPMESSLPPAPNPATVSAPEMTPAPEVNNMPEINYGQTTDELLPPPPTPPVDVSASMPLPTPDLGTPTPNIPTAPTPDIPTPNIPTPNIPAPEAPTATVTSASDTFTIPGA